MDEAVTDPCVTTRHAIDLPGGRLGYRADAGTVRVSRDDGSPLADVFYLAYRAESGATRWRPASPCWWRCRSASSPPRGI